MDLKGSGGSAMSPHTSSLHAEVALGPGTSAHAVATFRRHQSRLPPLGSRTMAGGDSRRGLQPPPSSQPCLFLAP